jgi:hypothetical protein
MTSMKPIAAPQEGGRVSEPSQGVGEATVYRVPDGDQAAQHQHDPQDDDQVDRNPHVALGDDSGHALDVADRGDRMDQIAHHPEQRPDHGDAPADPEHHAVLLRLSIHRKPPSHHG